jgi:hypothetical protein
MDEGVMSMQTAVGSPNAGKERASGVCFFAVLHFYYLQRLTSGCPEFAASGQIVNECLPSEARVALFQPHTLFLSLQYVNSKWCTMHTSSHFPAADKAQV